MAKSTIYIETSVVSYLAAPLSRDLLVAGHQQIAWEWWEKERDKFEIYISQVVIEPDSQ